MAVSASDIRSALSLPQAQSNPRKSQPSSSKKPDGISRELYSLIGPSAPSLAAHLAKPRLKQKPNFGGGGTAKWYAFPPPHTPHPTIQIGNIDHSETAHAQTPSSSPTGSNSPTPMAVGHTPSPTYSPLIPFRLSLRKVQRTSETIRLLPRRVRSSLGGCVHQCHPRAFSSPHRQRLVNGGNRLSLQDRTRI